MVDTSVTLSGVHLTNPVIPASGTFGYGWEFASYYDINILGALSFKGTTREARFGNPRPRIAEANQGILNAVGLQNPGIEKVICEELPKLRACYKKPIIANISGFSLDEYIYCAEKIDQEAQVELIELNVSCPNVAHGGMSFGTTPESVAEVTAAVKKCTTKPVYVKLSPNVGDIAQIALAAEASGADGISLINTLLAMRIDCRSRRPVLANCTGGLSGPAVFPLALRMVWQVYEAVKIPIIGIGGITTAADVVEMILAGATAVQIGAANLVNPCACRDIIADLPEQMAQYGIDSLSSIIGGAHS